MGAQRPRGRFPALPGPCPPRPCPSLSPRSRGSGSGTRERLSPGLLHPRLRACAVSSPAVRCHAHDTHVPTEPGGVGPPGAGSPQVWILNLEGCRVYDFPRVSAA